MNHRSRGNTTVLVVVVLLIAAIVGGWIFLSEDQKQEVEAEVGVTMPVVRKDFIISTPVTGELSAVQQIEIRNKLEDRSVITEIVPEGSFVKKGDLLVQLADDDIQDRIKDGMDKVKTGESSVVAAEQTLEIRRSAMQSDLDKGKLDIELAQLAVQAWEEGDLVSKRQSNEIAIKTAEIDLARLQNRFEQSQALVEKGFLSLDEFELDRIALIRGDAKVKEAKLARDVYESYQIKQDRARLESTIEQNIAERARVKQRHEAEIVKLEADVESAKFRLQTSGERLQDLKDDLKECTIIAPNDGLVVYASSLGGSGWRGRGDEPPPQVGTELRPNEMVMILPDTSQMIANLKVSEALSGRIQKGQVTTVYSDSKPGVPITGQVQGVSVLAESGGWRDPNRRDYTVKVLLDADPSMGLKPSMRCRGEIMLGEVKDAITVPIQSVFRKGRTAYVYLKVSGGYAENPVTLGRASEMDVEVKDGLTEGQEILVRRPKPGEVVQELAQSDVKSSGYTGSGMPMGVGGGKPSGYPGSGKPAGVGGGKPSGFSGSGKPAGVGGGKPSGSSGSGKPAGVGGGKPSGYSGSGKPAGVGGGKPSGYSGSGKPPGVGG